MDWNPQGKRKVGRPIIGKPGEDISGFKCKKTQDSARPSHPKQSLLSRSGNAPQGANRNKSSLFIIQLQTSARFESIRALLYNS